MLAACSAMFKIYFAPVVAPTGELFPAERFLEVQNVKNPKTRAEKYSVWKLLETALCETFDKPFSQFSLTKNAFGKWSSEECFFSLSHSHGVCCVAVSDAPVGVDIENFAAFKAKFRDKQKLAALYKKCGIACDIEHTSAQNAFDVRKAIAVWTAKEASFKLRGEGKFAPAEVAIEPTTVTVFRQFADIVGATGEWCVSYCGDHTLNLNKH